MGEQANTITHRNSVWVLLWRIAAPIDANNDNVYTVVVAVGPKKEDPTWSSSGCSRS